MINILKYKKQLASCKTEQELYEFIKRYKYSDESILDWLSRESLIDTDNTTKYQEMTSIS